MVGHSRPKALRFLAPMVLALMLALALSGISGGSAHAAPLVKAAPAHPMNTVIYWYQTGCGSSCGSGHVGVWYNFTAHWNSGPCCNLNLDAFWGDGGSDYYHCGFNCGDGYANFRHFWNRTGSFNTYAAVSLGGSQSNHVWMYIS